MTKYLALILTILSTSAFAIDNLRTAISTNNSLMIHQQNIENIKQMEEKKTVVEEGVKKYQTCIDKGLLYLGSGASDVDGDDCYDLSNTINPDTTFRPAFAGHTASQYAFRSGSAGYNTSANSRFDLDKLCHSQYAGSRAMTYDDIKYVMKDLIAPANIDKRTWVVDSVFDMYDSSGNRYISKYLDDGGVDEVRDCNGWNTTSTSLRANILYKKTNGAYTYLDFSNQLCSSQAYIACVYN